MSSDGSDSSRMDDGFGSDEDDLKSIEPAESTRKDLRVKAYSTLESVRDISTEERRALLTKRHLMTIPGIDAKTLAEVLRDNPDYFVDGLLQYIESRPSLRDYVSPKVSIALNLASPVLEGTFSKSQQEQLQVVEDYSHDIQREFPDARAIILPTVMYAQIDLLSRGVLGGPLFKNFFASALDQIPGPHVASIGRQVPGLPLDVESWNSDYGDQRVGAVPAVVFVK